MNIFDTIELKKPTFTKAEMKVCEAIAQNYVIVFHHSSNSLAEELHVSQASISRFCKKLGYEGYNEFRYALYDSVHTNRPDSSSMSKADCAKRIIDLLNKQADDGEYDHFVELLYEADHVFTTGVHRSSLPAKLLAIEMNMLKRFAVFRDNNEFSDWPRMAGKTLVVCCSEQGPTFRNGIEMLNAEGKNKPYTVLICTNTKHPLRRYFDEVIWLPNSINQNLPERVEPAVIYSIFVDIVISMLAEKLQKEEENSHADQ